ncbi:MAG: hypothetical protein PVG03_06185 [Desulfarculaceae bacterium]|jgi:hypothetical protein
MLKNKIAINIALISLWGIFCAFLGSTISSLAVADDVKNQIKTKKLSIIDDQGRERIVLGMDGEKVEAYFLRNDGKKTINMFIQNKGTTVYFGYPGLHSPQKKGESYMYIYNSDKSTNFGIMQLVKDLTSLSFGFDEDLSPALYYGSRSLIRFIENENSSSIKFVTNINPRRRFLARKDQKKASLVFNFNTSGPSIDLRDDAGEPVVRISTREPIKKLK